MSKRIEVRFRKLGREKAFGLAWCEDRRIDIDEEAHNGDEEKLLDTVIHEVLHIANPRLAEKTVSNLASELAPALFQIGYRRTHVNEKQVTRNQASDTSGTRRQLHSGDSDMDVAGFSDDQRGGVPETR